MSLPRGSSERERLVGLSAQHSASAGNGFASMDTEVPLSRLPPPLSPRSPRSPQEERQLKRLFAAAAIFALFLVTLVALLVATVARCRQEGGAGCLIPKKAAPAEWGGATLWPPKKTVSRIAFGSCAAYDVREQGVWEQGVIPSQPDAFVWLGDMFYGDEPDFDCNPQNQNASQCQCTADWLKSPPYMCMAGDMDNARDKMVAQVQLPGYQAFLQYACPGFDVSGASVPPGDDLEACPRPILVNNFNRRLPNKHLYKQIFLDAIGVSASSPRRLAQQGIQWHYKLNPETPREIELILLDERYERSPLPCQVRDEYCLKEVLPSKQHADRGWCEDFVHSGGEGSSGSCCKQDRAIFYGWCLQEAHRKDPLWDEACNSASPLFGSRVLYVQPDGSLAPRDVDVASQTEEDSSLCEVLGRSQRAWLDRVLSASTAPVKVIASGSVLFGSSPLYNNSAEDWRAFCSGDDWDCYRPAQLNLLHTLQRHAAEHGGCWIVITGDYHFSDIKVAHPGSGQPYSDAYQTRSWVTPIYQVMASGMTNSTARPNAACEGYRKESAGLRIEGDCGFVKLPAFGMLEFDWERRRLSMQIRRAEAPGGGQVLQALTISLDTCQPVDG